MGRLIDADEVKKRFPIMENDFGMVINERLHKELDKIPTVEAIPKDQIKQILDMWNDFKYEDDDVLAMISDMVYKGEKDA